MFKKKISLLLVLMLVFVSLVGCGEEAPAEPTGDQVSLLRWNLAAEPKTIDPQLNSSSDGGHVINNTFEGLMREVNGELEPGIAESYDLSEDQKTYTFHLRDAKWSDGKPVTASDFEYAWKRAIDPQLKPEPSEYAFQMFYIKGAQDFFEGKGKIEDVGIKSIDEKTLEVTLVAPTEYFLDLTSFYTYMPVRKDVVEKDAAGWARTPETAVSNGPFKLTEYAMGDKLILEKNENYWNVAEVKIDKIEAVMIVEQSTQLTAYESDELDVIKDPPVQEIPRLQKEDPTFQIRPLVGTYYYIFNVTKAPTDNVKVRKALTMAIDRKAITEKITKAGEIPATGFVPPALVDAKEEEFRKVAGDYGIDPNTAQVEEAKKLLAEAGYPDGKGFPSIEVIYNTNEKHKAVAEAIQAMWKENLGIEVKLANQEWAVFQDTRHNGNFTVARAGWLGDYADPMTMLDLWTSYSGNNDTQWKSEEYDALIEKSKEITGEGRFKLLYDAEKMMMDEMIVMPIYYYTQPVMVKEKVKNWQMTKLGHWFFGHAAIEE